MTAFGVESAIMVKNGGPARPELGRSRWGVGRWFGQNVAPAFTMKVRPGRG
jgi:hypothetical protein